MKKYLLVALCLLPIFIISFISLNVSAQSNNLADYGLTEEDVKYLTEEEKQQILKSKTPAQTQEYYEKGLKDGSIKPEDVPPPLWGLIGASSQQGQDTSSATPSPTDTVNCFDYYTFQSVKAEFFSSTNAVAGMQMDFTGSLKNENSYPVVGGTLYVKLFRVHGLDKDPNGPDVVDQFVALENINIPANSSVPASFKWQIPAYARSGDYQLATYFVTDKKFNLLGLSFTDDVVGNTFNFSIKGEDTGVYFDKSKVTINNEQFYFAASPPRIDKDAEGNIKTTVKNTTKETQQAEITWKIYKWDAMDPSNLIKTDKQTITINPNSETDLSIQVTDTNYPVYYIVGELTNRNTKSVVGIRFVREGVDRVRLNFPSITTYPLSKDQPNTMFTCLHNSGQSDLVANNKVVMDLLDDRGKVIDTYTYEGSVTGAMMGLKKDFTPKKDLTNFTLHTKLYTNNELVDESKVEYKCEDLDPAKCPTKTSFPLTETLIAIVVLLIIISAIAFFKKRSKGLELVVLLLVLASLFILNPQSPNTMAEEELTGDVGQVNPYITPGSKQALWNKAIIKNFVYYWNKSDGLLGNNVAENGWAEALSDPNITVKYNTKIMKKNPDGTYTEIPDESTVSPGDKLRFQFIPHHPYDIYWFGTGYSADSPYGEWRANMDPPPKIDDDGDDVADMVTCEDKDFVTVDEWIDFNYGVYIPLVIAPPTKTITIPTGLTNCTNMSIDEKGSYFKECTVASSSVSQIKPTFNFAETTGKFYYRYSIIVPPTLTGLVFIEYNCLGNQVALKSFSKDFTYENYPFIPNDDFTLEVPPQSITYTLNIATPPATNQPPNPPTITGATTTVVNKTVGDSYTFVATDPDDNQIKYEIDWDATDVEGETIYRQWLPSSEYVNSGTPLSTPFTFSSLPHMFRARTVDEHGATSSWRTYTVNELNYYSVACSNILDSTGHTQELIALISGGNAQTYEWVYNGTVVGTDSTYSTSTLPFGQHNFTINSTSTDGKFGTGGCYINLTENTTSLNATCVPNPSSVSPGGTVTFSVLDPQEGVSPYTYLWEGESTPNSFQKTYTIPNNYTNTNFTKRVTVKDSSNPQKEKEVFCTVAVNGGGGETPNGGGDQPPDVTLIIQPRLAPNCIARFVGPNNQSVPTLTGTQICELSGPYFTTITFSSSTSFLDTPITKSGLYTLSCGATPDSLVVIDSDICIGEGDSIQN